MRWPGSDLLWRSAGLCGSGLCSGLPAELRWRSGPRGWRSGNGSADPAGRSGPGSRSSEAECLVEFVTRRSTRPAPMPRSVEPSNVAA
jgi:hypothetical protein